MKEHVCLLCSNYVKTLEHDNGKDKYKTNLSFYLHSLPFLICFSLFISCSTILLIISCLLPPSSPISTPSSSFLYHPYLSIALLPLSFCFLTSPSLNFLISTFPLHYLPPGVLLLPLPCLPSFLHFPPYFLTSTFLLFTSYPPLLLSCFPFLPPRLAPSWKQKSPECCSCIREKGSWSLSPSTSSAQARQQPHSAHPESPDPHPHGLNNPRGGEVREGSQYSYH